MKLKAFAKLNLSLRVFDKRPDGYHNLESVMQSISLHDLITLTPIPTGIEVSCSDPRVPLGPQNLVYKAAELFFRELKVGIGIHIEKNIPMAAGLAGGSADAAAVLYGLSRLPTFNSQLSTIDLLELGARIGSDVPFCLTGGTCLVTGRGEVVAKQEPWPHSTFILVTPNIPVATKWAYDEFDRRGVDAGPEIKNDLEPVVAARHPEILELKERLIKLGCAEAQMSGSGPSVFGLIRDPGQAADAVRELRLDYPQSFVVETVGQGVEIIEP